VVSTGFQIHFNDPSRSDWGYADELVVNAAGRGSFPVPGQGGRKEESHERKYLALETSYDFTRPGGRRGRAVGRREVMREGEEWISSTHSLGIPLPYDNGKGYNSCHDTSNVLAWNLSAIPWYI
jgi:hypothetical protein